MRRLAHALILAVLVGVVLSACVTVLRELGSPRQMCSCELPAGVRCADPTWEYRHGYGETRPVMWSEHWQMWHCEEECDEHV